MPRIIHTEQMPDKLDPMEQHFIYNGLDCCITIEVREEMEEIQTPASRLIYGFERAMQAPAMEMMLRGIRVDMGARSRLLSEMENQISDLQSWLDAMATEVWGRGLNYNSPKQLTTFFYKVLRIPPILATDKQTRRKKPTCNREALEKLQAYFYARPFALTIMTLREIKKRIDVLRAGVDEDQRFRSNYNVAGTETGRWSSSANAFGSGGNAQNITDRMRRVFVADPGKKIGYFDLEQAESRLVGLLSYIATGKHKYLDACECGDLHTTVSRMVWPNLPWTGDLAHDKKHVAGQIFYRDFTYRDMAKRGGHGTNYYGTAFTMARHLKVPTKLIEDFQHRYFDEFDEIPEWHKWVQHELQTKGHLTTPMGRVRHFFGRSWDDATLREAIAFVPQGTIGDALNLALYNVWRLSHAKPHLGIELLGQVHDAILLQYPEEAEAEVVEAVTKAMLVTIPGHKGRDLIIPVEAAVGWNWAHYNDDADKGPINLDGVRAWKGRDERERQYRLGTSILDRVCA